MSIHLIIYYSVKYNLFHFLCIFLSLATVSIISFCILDKKREHIFSDAKEILFSVFLGYLLVVILSSLYILVYFDFEFYPAFKEQLLFSKQLTHFIVLGMISHVGMIVICCIYILLKKKSIPGYYKSLFKRVNLNEIRYIFFGFLMLIVINYLYEIIYNTGSGDTLIYVNAMKSLNWKFSVFGYIWVIGVVSIIEEIFFRGVLFRALKQTANVSIALIIQAMIFGLMHSLFIITFFHGLIYGYLTIKHNSIKLSLFLHVIYNAYVIVLCCV